jgi:GAF domain-containing protein
MLILALLAIALAAGWIAQVIVGRSHGRTDWTEALVAAAREAMVNAERLAGLCHRMAERFARQRLTSLRGHPLTLPPRPGASCQPGVMPTT